VRPASFRIDRTLAPMAATIGPTAGTKRSLDEVGSLLTT